MLLWQPHLFGHITCFHLLCKHNRYEGGKIYFQGTFPLFCESPPINTVNFSPALRPLWFTEAEHEISFFFDRHILTDSSTNEKSFTVNRADACFWQKCWGECTTACVCVCTWAWKYILCKVLTGIKTTIAGQGTKKTLYNTILYIAVV